MWNYAIGVVRFGLLLVGKVEELLSPLEGLSQSVDLNAMANETAGALDVNSCHELVYLGFTGYGVLAVD